MERRRIGLGLIWMAVGCGPETTTAQSDTGTGVGTTASVTDGATQAGSDGAGTVSATAAATTGAATSIGTSGGIGDSGNASSSGSGSETSASSTGGAGGLECNDASDCRLFQTCCECSAYPAAGPVPPDECLADCDRPRCDYFGITEAECRYGRCTPARASCDSSTVICRALPPVCEGATVPEVADGCWTGDCVPSQLCDVVPECAMCPGGVACVTTIPGVKGAPIQHTCVPVPWGCRDTATCDCAGDQICGDVGACSNGVPNEIQCAYP